MSSTTERHLTDAELLRVLDGQNRAGRDEDASPRGDRGTPPGDGIVARPADEAAFDPVAHAAACDRCGDALATLRAESELVTSWLERATFEESGPFARDSRDSRVAGPAGDAEGAGPAGPTPPPTGRFGAPVRPPDNAAWTRHSGPASRPRLPGAGAFLKAAAVILLLAAPLAAFPGVRAWVADRIVSTSTTESVTPDPVDAVTLRFTPAPGGFEVRFPAGTSGLLALDRSDGEDAELRALGGTPETVVTASSLEIRNHAAARYELRLPLTVTGVWVRVGERAVSVSDTQIGRGTVVELGR